MNLDRLRMRVREMGCVALDDPRVRGLVTVPGFAVIMPVTPDPRHPRHVPQGFVVQRSYTRLRAALDSLGAPQPMWRAYSPGGWGAYSRDRVVAVARNLDDVAHLARLHARISRGDEFGHMVLNGESVPSFGRKSLLSIG